MTSAELAAWLGIPPGRRAAPWLRFGLAAVPVPVTDAEHGAAWLAFVRAAAAAGVKPGARGMLASYTERMENSK